MYVTKQTHRYREQTSGYPVERAWEDEGKFTGLRKVNYYGENRQQDVFGNNTGIYIYTHNYYFMISLSGI